MFPTPVRYHEPIHMSCVLLLFDLLKSFCLLLHALLVKVKARKQAKESKYPIQSAPPNHPIQYILTTSFFVSHTEPDGR